MHVKAVLAAYISIYVWKTKCDMRYIISCHDDYLANHKDGLLPYHSFPWLGFIQYVHVTTGTPHTIRAPRVVLIHKQLILTAAKSFHFLPKDYKVGNVVFGDYEMEETDCGLKKEEILNNKRCSRAYLEVPLISFDTHPEFSRFGVKNSLAIGKLLTPMQSVYMVPVCLPTLNHRFVLKSRESAFLVDYKSAIPRNFDEEKMAKRTVGLFTHKTCRRQRLLSKLGPEGVTHILCTTGCGIRESSPIISHTETGRFEVIGLSTGTGPCINPTDRSQFNANPPIYIDVYPYSTWITSVVSAIMDPKVYANSILRERFPDTVPGKKDKNAFSTIYKQDKNKKKTGPTTMKPSYTTHKSAWNGRVYVVGNNCFASAKMKKKAQFIYVEEFTVTSMVPMGLRLTIIVDCGPPCKIVCLRIQMPNNKFQPDVFGFGTRSINITLHSSYLPEDFKLFMVISARNTTFYKKNRG